VESFKGGVTINGFKWKAGAYAEYNTAPGGTRQTIGKVVMFYRVTIPSKFPYPRVSELVLLQPCLVLGTVHGTRTLDINQGRASVLVNLQDVLCRIHVADHRTNPLLRAGIRAGNTRT
jgi:hypothetical protein